MAKYIQDCSKKEAVSLLGRIEIEQSFGGRNKLVCVELWEMRRAWARRQMLWSSSLIATPSAPHLSELLSLTSRGMSVGSQSVLTKPQVFPLQSSNTAELREEPASSKPIKHHPLILLSPQRGSCV